MALDDRAPPRTARDSHGFALAFGIERLGLASLRFPLAAALITLLLCMAAALGAARLVVDDSLSQLFRADTAEFRRFEAVTKRFPSNEYDVLIVVEGAGLLERQAIEKLRDLVTDVQLVEGTRGLISIFSARQPPAATGIPAPLFPDPLPEGDAYDALMQRVRANEIIKGKLLSLDGTLAMVVVALDPAMAARSDAIVAEIRETVTHDLEGAGLRAELAGVPVMQVEIRHAVERDRLTYNGLGFLAGCVIAILFFRRVSFMIVATAPPMAAILLSLGALGWLDFRLNMFLNVMTPLIMVISFSDTMQLTFAARERMIAGASARAAFGDAVRVVGPACVLTHATASLSFIALQFSDSELIRTFGQAGLIATLIALCAVLTLTPLLGLLLVRGASVRAATQSRMGDAGVDALRAFCGWIAGRMVRRAGLYSAIGLIVVVGLAGVYAGLEPRYRLADQVPDRQRAVEATGRLDAKLTGANPIDVLIELPPQTSLYAPDTLAVVAATHAALEAQAGLGNVWSLESLNRWIAEKTGASDVATLKRYVDVLPQFLVRRFISADERALVVSGRIPDIDASAILPVVDHLDHALDVVRAAHPGFTIAVTGLSAIAARNSATMIAKLSRGLTIEVVFVAAFIGLAFRSVTVACAALLPAVFPIVAAGALLAALGQGLQFASVVALTVSFGLGLSATIHFLNRLRLEDDPDADPAAGVERATVLMGPALIVTSIVLACALAVTAFSDLPALRMFGWLSAFAMLMALAADLLILRPTIMFLYSLDRRRRRGAAA